MSSDSSGVVSVGVSVMKQQLPLLNTQKPRLTLPFLFLQLNVSQTHSLSHTHTRKNTVSDTFSGFHTFSTFLNFRADSVGESEQKRGAGVELRFPLSRCRMPWLDRRISERETLFADCENHWGPRAGPQRLYGDLRPKTTRLTKKRALALRASGFGSKPHPVMMKKPLDVAYIAPFQAPRRVPPWKHIGWHQAALGSWKIQPLLP